MRESVGPDTVEPMWREDDGVDGLAALLESWTSVPALAYDPHLNVVGVNALGLRVLGIVPGENLARETFLTAGVNRTTLEWDQAATAVASALRASLETNAEDDDFLEMVGELAATSAEFPRLWAAWPKGLPTGDVTCRPGGVALHLRYTMLRKPELPGLTICVYQARDADGVALLEANSSAW